MFMNFIKSVIATRHSLSQPSFNDLIHFRYLLVYTKKNYISVKNKITLIKSIKFIQTMNSIENLRQQLRDQMKRTFEKQKSELQAMIKEEVMNQINKAGVPKIHEELRQEIGIERQLNEKQDMRIEKILEEIEDAKTQIKGIGKYSQQIEDIANSKEIKKILEGEEERRIAEEKQRIVEEIIKTEGIVDRNSAFLDKFQIDGCIVEKNSNVRQGTQLLGKIPIAQKSTNSFTILKGDSIGIGIIDPKWIGDRDSDELKRKEYILYNVWNGRIYESGNQVALCKFVSEGLTIVMTVSNNKVVWTVNQEVRASYSSSEISSNWVPFIQLYVDGNRVKWQ